MQVEVEIGRIERGGRPWLELASLEFNARAAGSSVPPSRTKIGGDGAGAGEAWPKLLSQFSRSRLLR